MSGLPFPDLSHRVLADLAAGRCASVTGLSNSGKSTLMLSLASPEAERLYREVGGRPAALIYIDCNRAVAISAQAFYEVVLRSLLERLAPEGPPELMATLRGYHQSVTDAATAFSASLSFNLALTDLCEQLGRDLFLLIDEFDELYTALDDRALLNLRALQDRFRHRMAYVTATVRGLPELRGRTVEDEFAEMFSRSTYPLPLLDDAEAEQLVQGLGLAGLTPAMRRACLSLAGGHPGLLIAAAQVLAGLGQEAPADLARRVGQEPQPRAECLKIWSQLTDDEQASLMALAVEAEAGLPPDTLHHLESLSLLRAGRPFSPIFAAFVARRAQGAEVAEEGVRLDPDSGDVWVDDVRIPVLTDLEYRLLKLLHERRDKLTDKYQIVTTVWGEAYLDEIDDARVEKLVSRLRSKIEHDPANPRYLVTLRGRGYKLHSRPRSTSA